MRTARQRDEHAPRGMRNVIARTIPATSSLGRRRSLGSTLHPSTMPPRHDPPRRGNMVANLTPRWSSPTKNRPRGNRPSDRVSLTARLVLVALPSYALGHLVHLLTMSTLACAHVDMPMVKGCRVDQKSSPPTKNRPRGNRPSGPVSLAARHVLVALPSCAR